MEDKTTPILEMLLNTLNARYNDYNGLLVESKAVLNRIIASETKDVPTPLGIEGRQLENYEPTIVNRLAALCSYFEKSNQDMKELYERLNKLA